MIVRVMVGAMVMVIVGVMVRVMFRSNYQWTCGVPDMCIS